MKLPKLTRLIVFVAICELVGILGSFFTVQVIPTWYAYLNKPTFNPPNWIFGPVWSLLYFLMGISAFLIWDKNKKDIKIAKSLFIFQLFLNGIWSPVFFGLKNLLLALMIITALWFFIILTILKFYNISKKAAYLLIPYILWVTFASILNYSVWRLN